MLCPLAKCKYDQEMPQSHTTALKRRFICCFTWFVFLVSRGGWAALPRGTMGLSAVCDCGIS